MPASTASFIPVEDEVDLGLSTPPPPNPSEWNIENTGGVPATVVSLSSELSDGYTDGLTFMFRTSCVAAMLVGLLSICVGYSGHYHNGGETVDTATQSFEATLLSNTFGVHRALILVGLCSIAQGGFSLFAHVTASYKLFFSARYFYVAVFSFTFSVLILAVVLQSVASETFVSDLDRLWNRTLQANESSICQVENSFVCSGFRSNCISSNTIEPDSLMVLKESQVQTFHKVLLDDQCPSSCVHQEVTGKTISLAGYFLTPSGYMDSNPYETPCLQRFASFLGITRTITISINMFILISLTHSFLLYQKIRNESWSRVD